MTILYEAALYAFALSYLAFVWYHFKTKNNGEALKSLRERAYQLFLKAEKLGFLGPNKMAWVAQEIWILEPTLVKIFIGQDTLTIWLQALYNEFVNEMAKVDPSPLVKNAA